MSNFESCKKCGKKLMSDDIAIYRKLVLRTADVSREAIEEKIRFFRESGNCTLFR